MGSRFGSPWSKNDVIKRRLKAHVKCLKAMTNETEFNSCATCTQIVLLVCLVKAEITHMGDKRTAWVSGDPKGSQEEVEEGRDRVKNTGERRRGEMGLSDFWVGELVHHGLTQIFPWSGMPDSCTLACLSTYRHTCTQKQPNTGLSDRWMTCLTHISVRQRYQQVLYGLAK